MIDRNLKSIIWLSLSEKDKTSLWCIINNLEDRIE